MRIYKEIRAAADILQADDTKFALVHQAALAAWGLDRNIFLNAVDVIVDVVPSKAVDAVDNNGMYASVDIDSRCQLRLWTAESLNLEPEFESVFSETYGCRVLAPESVFSALPLSPDYPILREQQAMLATILLKDEIADDELAEIGRFIEIV